MSAKLLRRTNDDGSAGCPPGSVGCLTDSDGHDLDPTQSAVLNMSIPMSTNGTNTSSSATSTSDLRGYDPKSTPGPQALIGILAIIALVLVFTLGGVALICGCKGERFCRLRKRKNRQPQVIHIDLRQETTSTSTTPELKAELP